MPRTPERGAYRGFTPYHFYPKSDTGFTLIELLCVIAIIGVLSTVVVAALQNARSKGIDASVKQSMTGSRSQAELFYTANNGGYYSGVCAAAPAGSVKSINSMFATAAQNENVTTINYAIGTGGSSGTATCHDTQLGWAAEIPLKLGGFFCVDSALQATTTGASTLGINDITCGP